MFARKIYDLNWYLIKTEAISSFKDIYAKNGSTSKFFRLRIITRGSCQRISILESKCPGPAAYITRWRRGHSRSLVYNVIYVYLRLSMTRVLIFSLLINKTELWSSLFVAILRTRRFGSLRVQRVLLRVFRDVSISTTCPSEARRDQTIHSYEVISSVRNCFFDADTRPSPRPVLRVKCSCSPDDWRVLLNSSWDLGITEYSRSDVPWERPSATCVISCQLTGRELLLMRSLFLFRWSCFFIRESDLLIVVCIKFNILDTLESLVL